MNNEISNNDKLEFMPYVVFLLNIVSSNFKYGLTPKTIRKVINSGEQFLNICYRLSATAQNHYFFRPLLENFIDAEKDPAIKFKMKLEKDSILALKHPDALNLANIAIISHFGVELINPYIEKLKSLDEELYKELFIDNRFRFLEIDIDNLDKLLAYIKSLEYSPFDI